MGAPSITIDLAIIEQNARTVTTTCARHGVTVFGVTKGTCGMPHVARAMLRGGVIGIAESRFENIMRLRQSGIDCPVLLLRSPPPSLVDDTVTLADISLNSELSVIEALSAAAVGRSRVHDVILMVDLGDLREGIWPDDLMSTVARLVELEGVRLVGIGTNLTCFGAVLPSVRNMGDLASYAEKVTAEFGVSLTYVSGGNSSSLPFLLSGQMPPGVNNLRIGEAILQGGRDTFFDEPWEELDRRAFTLTGSLVEVKVKPSVPIGETGVDAFGGHPVFEDRGPRLRGILNIGREDVATDALIPLTPGVEVLGASSDHLILDVTEAAPGVGDEVSFRVGYAALLAAMTSEYVEKKPMLDKPFSTPRAVRLAGATGDLAADLAALGFTVAEDGLPLAVGSSVLEEIAADAFGLIWLSAFTVPRLEGLLPRLSPENVALVGLREVSPADSAYVKESGMHAFTIVDIDVLGIREVMRRAVQVARNGTRGIAVSYHGPVTDTDGISSRETHQAMEIIAQTGSLLAMEVLDARSPRDYILSAFGRTIL